MTYTEALEKIDSLLVFGSKPGLERIQKLLSLMGDPQDKLRFVHVAGTNGKGSVCNMLACVLAEAGYKTGLFTSPHITSFGERMQINGEQIGESDVISLVEELFPLVEKMRADGDIITEFEFVTAMAFKWFLDMKCDVVVLETGLGGRFDATNVIKTPLCSVITSLSLDHTAVLGSTIEEIAAEKCGIIKEGGRTAFIHSSKKSDKIILETVRERGGCVYYASPADVIDIDIHGSTVRIDGSTYRLPLAGLHQHNNLSLVIAAVNALRSAGLEISKEAVGKGIERVRIPARFEVFDGDPMIILDGAHNPGGMESLAGTLRFLIARERRVVCLMGMLRDKECRKAAENLCGIVNELYVTTVPDSPRSQTAQQLKDTLDGLFRDVTACEDPDEAFDKAYSSAKKESSSILLICGSLYLAAYLRPEILGL